LPEAVRAHQPLFDETGALHAAALFDPAGALLLVREDIGRHNAVDKVVGAAARGNVNAGVSVLTVSGRASYEVIQKALAARIPCVVAVGGVSSLAVDLAKRAKMVLVGFVRSGGMSIYSGAESVR
jgi:FdhD protein